MTSSISSILSVASSALTAQRSAMEVTSHNIANASTEGFSRQRPVLEPGTPLRTPQANLGTGVRLENVDRVRDSLVDVTVRRESSAESEFQQRADFLGRVESLLGEPSDAGLGATMDRFFNAFSDLANDPTSSSARTVVRERGRQLAETFNRFDQGLETVRDDARKRLDARVSRLNRLADRVAGLNRDIVAAESGGNTAGDLRDQRDLALDEIAKIVDVQVREDPTGSVKLYAGGTAFVDGATTRKLEVADPSVSPTSQLEVGFDKESGFQPIDDPGGAAGGLLRVYRSEVPDVRRKLDALAFNLAEEVNAVHSQGVNPDGDKVDFFQVDQTAPNPDDAAATISLSDPVAADASAVAAGTGQDIDSDGDQEYAPGANDVALDIAALRNTDVAGLGDQTFSGHFGDTVAELGLQVAAAEDGAEARGALRQRAESQRARVSGVSTDEEMLQLIRHQQAFQAAARVVTTADQMMQSLLAI